MSETAVAVASPPEKAAAENPVTSAPPSRGPCEQITELRVTAHLMTLDRGLFCLLRQPTGALEGENSSLPGVRVSVPPGEHPDSIAISTFRADGWLGPSDGAALIRVAAGRAQVLVTIYQMPGSRPETAPRIQVLRLSGNPENAAVSAGAPSMNPTVQAPPEELPEVVVHVQNTGDVGQHFGTWLGTKGSKQWIEGFGISPPDGLQSEDIEYQAVLGKGWMSPWVAGGKFCGSRGMALPLLGIRVRLSEKASRTHTALYSATFTDGTEIGPVADGEPCESASLAPLETLNISIKRRSLKPSGKTVQASRRSR
jgi:hypothetical protein